MTEIRFEGLTALVQGINMQKAKKQKVQSVVMKNGSKLHSEAQKRMRKGVTYVKGYSNDNTKNSTTLDIQNGGMTAVVAPDTEYFPYIEYGTRKMEAEPTLGPAFRFVATSFMNDIKELMNER